MPEVLVVAVAGERVVTDDDIKRAEMDRAWEAYLKAKARAEGGGVYVAQRKSEWINESEADAQASPKPTPVARQPKHTAETPIPPEDRPAEVVGARCRWEPCWHCKNGTVIACLGNGFARVRFDDHRTMKIPFEFLSVPPEPGTVSTTIDDQPEPIEIGTRVIWHGKRFSNVYTGAVISHGRPGTEMVLFDDSGRPVYINVSELVKIEA
jgi:hypothetical protein